MSIPLPGAFPVPSTCLAETWCPGGFLVDWMSRQRSQEPRGSWAGDLHIGMVGACQEGSASWILAGPAQTCDWGGVG